MSGVAHQTKAVRRDPFYEAMERPWRREREQLLDLNQELHATVRGLRGQINILNETNTQLKNQLAALRHSVQRAKSDMPNLPSVSIASIVNATVTEFDITANDLLSRRRDIIFARPRQVAMYLAKKFTVVSFPVIAKFIGGRDHTTVMYAVKTIERLRQDDPFLEYHITNLETLFNAVGCTPASDSANPVHDATGAAESTLSAPGRMA